MTLSQVPTGPGTEPYQIPLLVIDDEPILLESVRELLLFEGYDVHTTCSGSEGLALAGELLPHCILLDLKLRDTDGFTVLKQFKRQQTTRHIPVIVLSAYSQDQYRTDALALGAFACFTKPFNTRALLAAIERSMMERTTHECNTHHR
jgi:DNA-binding response OmpR family regulator